MWVGLIALLLIAGLLFTRTPKTASGLPSVSFVQMDGAKLDLASLKGKPVVLNAWATWCGPCRRELPLMIDQAKARPDVVFTFVNQGEGPEAVKAYQKETRLQIPNVLLDTEFKLADLLALQGLPTTYFFDKDGKLVGKHIGELSKAQLEEALKDL